MVDAMRKHMGRQMRRQVWKHRRRYHIAEKTTHTHEKN